MHQADLRILTDGYGYGHECNSYKVLQTKLSKFQHIVQFNQ
jgi:hypothetical protein